VWREGLRPPDPFARRRPPTEELRTQDGMSLATLCRYGPVVVVFLPALGTPECGSMLGRVAKARAGIEEEGTRVVLVHMAADDAAARAELEPYDLHYLARVADPGQELYDDAGLGRRTAGERLSPGRLLRKLVSGRRPIHGDPARAGGAYLLSGDPPVWTARRSLG